MNDEHKGTDSTAERATRDPASRPTTSGQALREIRSGVAAMWWGFFNWLAIVSWKMLLLVSFLSLILAGAS